MTRKALKDLPQSRKSCNMNSDDNNHNKENYNNNNKILPNTVMDLEMVVHPTLEVT
jgi:hypothetical protein